MGVALWLLSGIVAFAASRAIAAARPERYAAELAIVLIVSAVAGAAATALDFGGWGELDWRAGVFAFLCAFAAAGIARAAISARRSPARQ